MFLICMLVGLLIGGSGLALVGVGIAMAGSGSAGPGLFGMGLGLFVTLGGYLLVRAALRMRSASGGLSPGERKVRSRATKYAVASALVVIVSVVLLPVPGVVRVVVCVIAVLTLPLGLARDFEPRRR